MGLTWRTGISHELEGQVNIQNPSSALLGGLSSLQTNRAGFAELDLPSIASLGFSQQIDDQWTVLGSVNYYKWDSFNDIPVSSGAIPGGFRSTPQDYQNTWGFALGAKYRLNDQWLLKGGFQYDQTPTVTSARSTRVPDGDRMWFAGGFTYSINPKMDLDVSGAYVHVQGTRVDVVDTYSTGTVRTRGDSDGYVGIAGAAIRYKF